MMRLSNCKFRKNQYNLFMAEIILTDHAKYRLLEREIDVHEAKKIAKNGRIIKNESDGTITKVGVCNNSKSLVVVSIKEKGKIIIKTAYYGN